MALISQAKEQSTVNQRHPKARMGTSSRKYKYMTQERGTCGKVLLASKGVVLQDKWVTLPPSNTHMKFILKKTYYLLHCWM